MEYDNTLENVARMMDGLRHVGVGTYTLIASNHKLSLTNSKDLPPYSCVVDKFTSVDINEGLTPARWNELHAKILSLIHKGTVR